MIYTLTLNPALDYHLGLPSLKLGETNRSVNESIVIGGKGINVSLMLQNFGVQSVALGFLAGFSGEEILKRLRNESFESDFVFLQNGFSRINVKIKAQEESEINANGPIPTQDEIHSLTQKLCNLTSKDILVLSGSLAKAMRSDFYAQVMKECEALVVLDVSGEPLELGLSYAPFLIKPNKAELEAMFAKKLTDKQEVFECAKILQEKGARNVLVSLGGEGAVFLDENQNRYTLKVPKGELLNSVGAGDSMVAGFLVGYLQEIQNQKSPTQALREGFYYSVASGSASAYSEGFGSKERVMELLKQLKEEQNENH